jgi:hypothetical protein
MKTALALALVLAGCVDGLAPAEIGIGRRVGMFPGDVAAVLPPMTDRAGNLYVVTGQPDSTGSPQAGTALTGGARGGWSMGCSTGMGALAGARGWIGAVDGRGWLWTKTAILELDVDGTCTTKLDFDPVSSGDIQYLAVAPIVHDTVSGRFALALLTTGADATAYLATIDLDLGIIRSSTPLPGTFALATGADQDRGDAAFLVGDAAGTKLLFARPHDGIVETVAVTGMSPGPTNEIGEVAFGTDGSIAATLRTDTVAVGTRAGLSIKPAPLTARRLELDDAGALWLTGLEATSPKLAPVAGGELGAAQLWTSATAIDAALSSGVIVIDERGGGHTATRWQAHAAYGPSALVPTRSAPDYAVGARAVLVADPAADNGGIPYSQLAVVPVGVEFP